MFLSIPANLSSAVRSPEMNNTSASPAYNDDSDCSSRHDGETERQKEKDEL